jgi:glutamate racemase
MRALGFLCLPLLLGSAAADDAVLQRVVDHAASHADGRAAVSFERAAYEGHLRDLPIGVFDSGIGGLTVLEAILALDAFDNASLQPGADGVPDFAQERFVYLGDQANMPYGNYPAAGRTDYLRELILKDAVFLLGRRWHDGRSFRFDKPPVKAVVIACNTATAYGLEDLRAAFRAWGLPVILVGVVEAGARGVLAAGESREAVGVLATVGTCASGAYPRLIEGTLGRAGRAVPAVAQHGSAALAGVIEGDPAFMQSVADCAAQEARALLETLQRDLPGQKLGTLVLGCTHYPLARAELDAAFAALRADADFAPLLSERLAYVDPAEWTARELFRELARAGLRLKPGETCRMRGHAFYLSVPNPASTTIERAADGGLDRDFKYGRLPGQLEREDTVNVPLRVESLPSVGRNLIEKRLPQVWRAMTKDA